MADDEKEGEAGPYGAVFEIKGPSRQRRCRFVADAGLVPAWTREKAAHPAFKSCRLAGDFRKQVARPGVADFAGDSPMLSRNFVLHIFAEELRADARWLR